MTTNQKTATAVGAVLAISVGVMLVPSPPAPRKISIAWDKNDTNPATVTEVWTTTNLSLWTLKTNVAGSNVTLLADKPQEFFKIRNNLFGQVSDWARK